MTMFSRIHFFPVISPLYTISMTHHTLGHTSRVEFPNFLMAFTSALRGARGIARAFL